MKRAAFFRVLIVIGFLFTLVACGGGGSGKKSNRSSMPASVASSVSNSTINSSVDNSVNSSTANSAINSSTDNSANRSISSIVSSSINNSVANSASSLINNSVGSSLISSMPASSAASSGALAAPQNVAVVPANGSVTLSWNPVTGASSYNIYYASEPDIIIANIASFDDGTWLQSASSPRVINSLRNNETYYFVVTAVGTGVESVASVEVSATPSAIDLAKQPTAQEVLVVELINRARANPEAEAARYGIGLNDGISGTMITATPKQPLAHNLLLIDSARKHSQWMLDTDIFSHTGVDNTSPTQRMAAAGYAFTGNWTSGENIAWGGTSGSSINLTNYALSHHENLFKSPGHRFNILEPNFREIGVGQKQGYFVYEGTNYLSSMLTQNFARAGSNYYLTGVVYSDTNNNDFYDVGEGLSGITISFNGNSYPAYSTGAYTIPVVNGTYNLTITGDLLGSAVYHSVQINNANTKLDVIKSGAAIDVVSW